MTWIWVSMASSMWPAMPCPCQCPDLCRRPMEGRLLFMDSPRVRDMDRVRVDTLSRLNPSSLPMLPHSVTMPMDPGSLCHIPQLCEHHHQATRLWTEALPALAARSHARSIRRTQLQVTAGLVHTQLGGAPTNQGAESPIQSRFQSRSASDPGLCGSPASEALQEGLGSWLHGERQEVAEVRELGVLA